jgi:hypothetical protein
MSLKEALLSKDESSTAAVSGSTTDVQQVVNARINTPSEVTPVTAAYWNLPLSRPLRLLQHAKCHMYSLETVCNRQPPLVVPSGSAGGVTTMPRTQECRCGSVGQSCPQQLNDSAPYT